MFDQTDFQNYLNPLDYNDIKELAMFSPEINNVFIGIKKHLFCTMGDPDSMSFHFFYLSGGLEKAGYRLELHHRQKDFYSHIMSYCYHLSLEFAHLEPVHVYNSYLYQYRTGLESKGVQTISNRELDYMKTLTNDPEPEIISPYHIEIIPYLEAKEFYQALIGWDDKLQIEDGKNYVYLLFNNNNKYFKIGRSKTPLKREKTLQGQDPDNILLMFIEADKKTELDLHRKYFKKRVRGEWFKLTVSDLIELKQFFNSKSTSI